MRKFEYTVLRTETILPDNQIEQDLDEYGEAGWELVNVVYEPGCMPHHRFFLKREIVEVVYEDQAEDKCRKG